MGSSISGPNKAKQATEPAYSSTHKPVENKPKLYSTYNNDHERYSYNPASNALRTVPIGGSRLDRPPDPTSLSRVSRPWQEYVAQRAKIFAPPSTSIVPRPSDFSSRFRDPKIESTLIASDHCMKAIDDYLNREELQSASARQFNQVLNQSAPNDRWFREQDSRIKSHVTAAQNALYTSTTRSREIREKLDEVYHNRLTCSQSYREGVPDVTLFEDPSKRTLNYERIKSSVFKRPVIRPKLTDKMLVLIDEAMELHPPSQELARAFDIPITRKDIQTLRGLNWLNDEIINYYMQLIVERGKKAEFSSVYAFNTFFFSRLRESGHSALKRWTRRVDIFSYECLIVPVHLGNHWCLAFIDLKNKSLSYFDSLGGGSHGCLNLLADYLREESMDKKKVELSLDGWNLNLRYEDIPQQTNCSDCGVFACTYAEYLTRRADFDFGQGDMPFFRKKMVYEILTKELLTFRVI